MKLINHDNYMIIKHGNLKANIFCRSAINCKARANKKPFSPSTVNLTSSFSYIRYLFIYWDVLYSTPFILHSKRKPLLILMPLNSGTCASQKHCIYIYLPAAQDDLVVPSSVLPQLC